ncbi:sugar phosphate isomerase/epimerase family protein [Microbacterium sp. PMB16]|uniref:sugar phosphate isomerase/epimerase family protein n=1 Tax=Microbacterium sp. PMB16 TaxID=3120157 RepID=UPI003F4B1DE5
MTHRAPIVLMTDWVAPLPPAELFASAREQGYDGVEMWWPADPARQRDLRAVVERSDARVSLLATSGHSDPRTHIAELQRTLREISESGISPLHVTLHAGRDHWDDGDHDRLADAIRATRADTALDVLVELHRARMLFAAHAARRILERHPDLRVTFDISHWLVVAESMLDDQTSAVDLAIDRADHIHARIGHPQGPQVNDPEAPEWREVVGRHLQWWDRIVERLRNEGRPVTFLAEFGPVDYAPSEAGSRVPLRDPASSNRWMLRTLRERYREPDHTVSHSAP